MPAFGLRLFSDSMLRVSVLQDFVCGVCLPLKRRIFVQSQVLFHFDNSPVWSVSFRFCKNIRFGTSLIASDPRANQQIPNDDARLNVGYSWLRLTPSNRDQICEECYLLSPYPSILRGSGCSLKWDRFTAVTHRSDNCWRLFRPWWDSWCRGLLLWFPPLCFGSRFKPCTGRTRSCWLSLSSCSPKACSIFLRWL